MEFHRFGHVGVYQKKRHAPTYSQVWKKDSFDGDPNSVSVYDGMHGPLYEVPKWEGMQM